MEFKKYFGFVFFFLISTSFNVQIQTKKWLAVGDSITYLNDHQNETQNRITKGYMTLVCQKIPQIMYINKGFNGWSAVKMAEKIDQVKIENADIVSVFLGTNDWWQGQPIGTIQDFKENTGFRTFYGAYRILLDKIYAESPTAKVVLISPLQRGDFVYINNYKNNAHGSYLSKNNQNLEDFVFAIDKIAKLKNLPFIDLFHDPKLDISNAVKYKLVKNKNAERYSKIKYTNYISLPFNPETDKYPYPISAQNITFDGLHPSNKGYKFIANKLIVVFKNF